MYQQAPYQEIDQEAYESALAKMPKTIDWGELAKFEKESNVVQQREYACTGDLCVYA
jgi:ribonucleoside-diphosphate reductase alpha chain